MNRITLSLCAFSFLSLLSSCAGPEPENLRPAGNKPELTQSDFANANYYDVSRLDLRTGISTYMDIYDPQTVKTLFSEEYHAESLYLDHSGLHGVGSDKKEYVHSFVSFEHGKDRTYSDHTVITFSHSNGYEEAVPFRNEISLDKPLVLHDSGMGRFYARIDFALDEWRLVKISEVISLPRRYNSYSGDYYTFEVAENTQSIKVNDHGRNKVTDLAYYDEYIMDDFVLPGYDRCLFLANKKDPDAYLYFSFYPFKKTIDGVERDMPHELKFYGLLR